MLEAAEDHHSGISRTLPHTEATELRAQGRATDSGFRIQGSGFGDQGSSFRDWANRRGVITCC